MKQLAIGLSRYTAISDGKAKVLEYMDSFEKNILNMHPIILPRQLRALVQVFLDTRLQAGRKAPTAGTKRKRSPISDPDTINAPYKPSKPSIDDGLALLVLALGKACLHKGKMPDMVRSDGLDGEQQRQPRGLPTQRSPPGSHSTSGLPSPKLEDRKGREGAKELGRQPPFWGIPMPKRDSSLKNYDVIPGLEYFAPATDILGNQMAGSTLKHVWAHILAGLYYDQLARPIESFTHITAASRALLTIFRPLLSRLESYKIRERRDNQLVIAFWTCSCLESDLLAEMPLVQSGILNYDMLYPNISMLNEGGVELRVCESYIGQLYLHKRLKMFDEGQSADGGPALKFRQDMVPEKWVGNQFKFCESDPPAADILSARLRAAYWHTQVAAFRPFIKQILQFSHGIENHLDVERAADIRPDLLEHAGMGINALIESTSVFQGLAKGERPIITNAFGTAHAQWGNILVLAACCKSDVLRRHVDESVLGTLFSRTIDFFELISVGKSALNTDLNILRALKKRLFSHARELALRNVGRPAP